MKQTNEFTLSKQEYWNKEMNSNFLEKMNSTNRWTLLVTVQRIKGKTRQIDEFSAFRVENGDKYCYLADNPKENETNWWILRTLWESVNTNRWLRAPIQEN